MQGEPKSFAPYKQQKAHFEKSILLKKIPPINNAKRIFKKKNLPKALLIGPPVYYIYSLYIIYR